MPCWQVDRTALILLWIRASEDNLIKYNLEIKRQKKDHKASISLPQSITAYFSFIVMLLPTSLSNEKRRFPKQEGFLISSDITEFYDPDGAKVMYSAN